MSSRVGPAAAAPPKVVPASGRRARSYRRFDPHTALDLKRKLTPNECRQLVALRDRLGHIEHRLQVVAGRHNEYV